MTATLWVKLAGVYFLGFALFHLLFSRLFGWRQQFRTLSPLNRAIVPTINLCLAFFFALFGWLEISRADEMLSTDIGNLLLMAAGFFWLLRALLQVVWFDRRRSLSWFMTSVFIVGAGLNLMPIYVLLAVN